MQTDVLIKPSSLQAWFLATRPKTLLIILAPMLTGTALGLKVADHFHWALFLSALISGLLVQIGVNLVNDALDFKKGADTSERLGPARATQSGWLPYSQVLNAGISCFCLAFLVGVPMIIYGGFYFLLLLTISPILAYCYTGGPFPLAYKGFGELFSIAFFGVIATLVAFYLQASQVTNGAILAGFQLGLLSAAVIAINNLRDIESDTKAKKMTLAARFGIFFGRLEITIFVLLPYFLNVFWIELGFYKAALLPLMTLPLGFTFVRCLWYYGPSKIYNTYLAMAALLNFLFGLFLSIGFWI